MPYANDICGIYRIVNTTTNECYVGQSQYMKKRVKEHFRLLRLNKHPNPRLQNSFNKYGEKSFRADFEIVVELLDELDMLEEGYITGKIKFDTPVVFNIANFAKAPMRGKFHSEETRCKIRKTLASLNRDFTSPEWRAKLSEAQTKRYWADSEFRKRLKFILENEHLSYAERARQIGSTAGSVRKLYLKYKNHKELLP